jgi:hypothetical protein
MNYEVLMKIKFKLMPVRTGVFDAGQSGGFNSGQNTVPVAGQLPGFPGIYYHEW